MRGLIDLCLPLEAPSGVEAGVSVAAEATTWALPAIREMRLRSALGSAFTTSASTGASRVASTGTLGVTSEARAAELSGDASVTALGVGGDLMRDDGEDVLVAPNEGERISEGRAPEEAVAADGDDDDVTEADGDSVVDAT